MKSVALSDSTQISLDSLPKDRESSLVMLKKGPVVIDVGDPSDKSKRFILVLGEYGFCFRYMDGSGAGHSGEHKSVYDAVVHAKRLVQDAGGVFLAFDSYNEFLNYKGWLAKS